MAAGSDRRLRVWDRLEHSPDHGVNRLTVEGSPVLAPQEIRLGQLTVVTGTHGVGKSYLLRSIAALLPRGYGNPMGPPFFGEFAPTAGVLKGRFTADYVTGQAPCSWTVDLDEPRPGYGSLSELGDKAPWTRYVEPSLMFFEYSMLFQSYDAFMRQTPSRTLTPPRREELEYLRDIVGRRYEGFTWREIDTEPTLYSDQYLVPHVEATTADGRTITSAQMSSGELWVHYVLWSLHTAGPEQVVLIDEPESFLSPAGHRAFIDEIARLTVKTGTQTIVATHSAAMIARTPAHLLRVLTPGPRGARIVTPTSPMSALRMLGHDPGLAGIVVVEDKLACAIMHALLTRFDSQLAHRLDVIACEGKDKALATARVLAKSSRLGVCVVLDGDQRAADINERGIHITYLPGNEPDDALLLSVLDTPDRLAERIAARPDDVAMALDALRFQPHQKWFSLLAGSLGLPEGDLVNHLIHLWLDDDAVRTEAERIVRTVGEAVFSRAR